MPSIFDSLHKEGEDTVRVHMTPEMAVELLEANKHNRPLDQTTISRITRKIQQGKWRYNGDTIKITNTFDILDGQHRLWAIIEAKRPVETLIAFGIDREAFETIDTIRKLRSYSDTIALEGQTRYRTVIGTSLSWLIRYERGVLLNYKASVNRIENSDIKDAFRANPNIVQAVTRAMPLRRLVNSGLVGFFYYITAAQNTSIAEEMIEVLADPSRTPLNHPFYLLRAYFASELTNKDPIKSIALMIKATNATYRGQRLTSLEWRAEGKNPERYPLLDVRNLRKENEV